MPTDTEMLETLRILGVTRPEVGRDGMLYTGTGNLEVVSVKVTDTTPPPLQLLNAIKPKAALEAVRPAASFPPCIFGFEPWCPKARWITRYLDPTLIFDVTPLEIKNVHFYLWGLRLEGDISTKFTNDSFEGKVYEENDQTGERRNERTVSGSADLGGNLLSALKARDLNEVLATVRNAVTAAARQWVPSLEAHWTKSGGLSTLKSLVELLLKGRLYTDGGIDATVNYNWQGPKTISKHIDLVLWLPVKGGVSYHWS